MPKLRALVVILCSFILVGFAAIAIADTSYSMFLGQLEQQYNLPTGILWKVAIVESGGNVNTSCSSANACGLFQWTPNSWLSATKAVYGQSMSLSDRNDPTKAAVVTAYELGDIKYKLGSLITQANVDMTVGLYLGHFLGISGAQHFLQYYIQNPGGSACGLFPKECSYNSSVMSGRTLAGVINYFAAKLQSSGVPNVPGNFQDQSGTSYAYSSAYLNSSDFLPANTMIGTDPEYDYPPSFTPVATNSNVTPTPVGTVLPNAPQTAPPASYTTPPQAAQALSSSATSNTTTGTTASTQSQCSAQYYCQNSAIYYQSDSCSTTVFQTCQYGCSGTVCAAATSSTSNANPILSAQPTGTSVATPQLDPSGALDSFFATSTPIGTSTSLTSGNFFSVVEDATATSLTATSDDSVSYENTAEGISASGTSQFEGQSTLSGNSSQNVYIPAPLSPFDQVLNALKNALTGLLTYLHTL